MISKVQRLFETGSYQEILSVLKAKKLLSGDEATSLICSLSFLGQQSEAIDYWNVYHDKLSDLQRCRCRFALGVAFTRVSKLKAGRKFFHQNLTEAKSHRALAAYAYQGVGFYYYFIGRFAESRKWAKKASEMSLKLQNGFIRFLAIDLLGHCEVQLGQRGEGLKLMRQAANLALAHGNSNFAAAFDVASLIYEAEVGARPLKIERELRDSLTELNVQDSYTRGNLLLELARQLTLRGRWSEAKETLSLAAASIYSFSNRRQEFTLQMRLAELSFCQGENYLTEHFIQSAKRCLNAVSDKAFEVKLLGIEQKFLTSIGRKVPRELISRLRDLSKDHGSHINEQILFRQNQVTNPKIGRQDDPLHHLFLKQLRSPDQAATEALELGYLGLWQRFKNLAAGKSYFVILPDQQSFIILNEEQVLQKKETLSRQQLRLLQVLQSGFNSKEDLIREVWGYDYDPARHDALVYSTFAKLRKVIEPASKWLVTVENGWSLDPSVEWLLPQLTKIRPSEQQNNFTPLPDLNFRQVEALRVLGEEGMWSITQYKKRFDVSTMTAFRDLSGLLESRLLVKTGRARATRYHLAQKGS